MTRRARVVQAETEVASLTKRVRQVEEDFESTETRLVQTQQKLEQASKAADDSERLAHPPNPQIRMLAIVCGTVILHSVHPLIKNICTGTLHINESVNAAGVNM